MAAVADLFAQDDDARTIEQAHVDTDPIERAIQSIERVLRGGWPCWLAFSSGKDSSACANLLLNAALNIVLEGLECPPIVIGHSDTGVESPVVRALADGELEKIARFARDHGLPVQIHVGRPTLAASFATRVIGGRALPSFPNLTRDCAISWKRDVAERGIRGFSKRCKAEGRPQVVTIIGTRSDESSARAANTAARKETAHEVWYTPTGKARLSPILDWTSDDVWTFLGESAAGVHPTYSDFGEVMDFYRSAGGSSCVVVADMQSVANSKACGARSGCWSCVQVQNDRSVETMIELAPDKYPYLVPLLQLRNFISRTQWDWGRRNFIGRTIVDGSIKVQADQYSPAMCEDLLRYTLAAQELANELGSPSRVETVGLRELIAIDFWWSIRAWHPPFHALWVYFDHVRGNRRYAPEIKAPYPPSPTPVLGEIRVGKDWDEEWSDLFPSGLRYPAWELFSDSCGPQLRSSPAGKVFLQLEETPELDVDEEAAADFLEFIAPEKIEQMHRADYCDWTAGAMTYLQYGTVTPASGSSSMVDNMMRRSQWLQQHGLHGHQTAEMLLPRCSKLASAQTHLFV